MLRNLQSQVTQEQYNRQLEFESRDLQLRELRDQAASLFKMEFSRHPDIIKNCIDTKKPFLLFLMTKLNTLRSQFLLELYFYLYLSRQTCLCLYLFLSSSAPCSNHQFHQFLVCWYQFNLRSHRSQNKFPFFMIRNPYTFLK